MLGEYPVIVNGEETGTLRVSREGLMTLFDAHCRDPGELLRLSVYGEREAYLGVMAPDGQGEVRLRKSYSRSALAGFPENIRFAGPSGLKAAEGPPDAPDAGPANAPPEPETPEKTEPPRPPQTPEASTSAPERPKEDGEEQPPIRWRHGAGGALVGADADRRYLAIPIKAGVLPVGGDFERKTIADSEYAVFVLKSAT